MVIFSTRGNGADVVLYTMALPSRIATALPTAAVTNKTQAMPTQHRVRRSRFHAFVELCEEDDADFWVGIEMKVASPFPSSIVVGVMFSMNPRAHEYKGGTSDLINAVYPFLSVSGGKMGQVHVLSNSKKPRKERKKKKRQSGWSMNFTCYDG